MINLNNSLQNNDSQDISTNRSQAFASSVSAETVEDLKKEVLQLKEDFKKNNKEIEKIRFDTLTLMGIFVGLITYLGLEIQVFKSIDNPLLIIGISLFFIASILLFILSINMVIKKIDSLTWKDFNNPLYIILTVLLISSIIFIIYGSYKDPSYKDNFHIQFLSMYE